MCGWVELLAENGTEVFATAFPDIHREPHTCYVADNIVIVQLSLQGTHLGPLATRRHRPAD